VQTDIIAGAAVLFSWESGKAGARGKYPLARDAFKFFMEAKRKEGLRDYSIKSYEWKIMPFLNCLSMDSMIDDITESAINKWRLSLIENGTAAASINSYIKHLKVFLMWVNDRFKMAIPTKIKPLKNKASIKYIPDDVFENILIEADKVNPLLAWAFEFYRRTGARLREVYNADIFPMTLRVAPDKSKSGRARVIPLLNGESEKVRELRAAYTPERLSRLFHIASEAVGESHRFHDLRHTAGVLIYIETRDIMEVKHRLGHSTLAMSERYTNFDYYQLREDFPERFANERRESLKIAR